MMERERLFTEFEEERNCQTRKKGRGNRREKRERENERERAGGRECEGEV